MEVRVERKKKNSFLKGLKKLHMVWKALAVMLVIGALAGGMALWFGRDAKPAMAAEFQLEFNPITKKYVFNVVEVVPEKQSAILGLYIGGEEGKTISLEKLNTEIQKETYSWDWWCKETVYWSEKNITSGSEPFSIEINSQGKKTIVNNEIFKLYMLGAGKYNPSLSIYENLISPENQKNLKAFNEQYEINYQILTPEELDSYDISKIQYMHFGGPAQISSYPQFYAKVGLSGAASDNGKTYEKDISWKTALDLYKRAVPPKTALNAPKMSISMSNYQMVRLSHSWNIYKLYQMLHYFDDPSVFRETFKGGKMETAYGYVDESNGFMYVRWDANGDWAEKKDWDDEFISQLALADYPHTGMLTQREDANYIPEKYDNVLLFYKWGEGYFDHFLSMQYVNQILHPSQSGGEPSEDSDDGRIKILEIEPCNSYWLDVKSNLTNLALAIGVEDTDELAVTKVTPNALNGMAVDLVAEYDLILIGDDISQFNSQSGYSSTNPYRHIGFYEDAVVLQTLLNGLLKDDYTTEGAFNDLLLAQNIEKKLSIASEQFLTSSTALFWNLGIKKQWGDNTGRYFLKNVALSLKLGETVSKARFSGNDISRHMQRQLVAFLDSGQPVIITSNLKNLSETRMKEYARWDAVKGSKRKDEGSENSFLDSRMYYALCGMKEDLTEADEVPVSLYSPDGNMYLREEKVTGAKKTVALSEFKPIVRVEDRSSAQEDAGKKILEKRGLKEKEETLSSLQPSTILSFNYEIELPFTTDRAEDYLMQVIIDKNGDGMFDSRDWDGKKEEEKKTEYRFSEHLGEFVQEAGLIKGTYTAGEPLAPSEEMVQFRVIVSKDKKEGTLRGEWTGYVRPAVSEREIKILQITPYSENNSGRPINQNPEFLSYMEAAQTIAGEYKFDFVNGYDVISEGDFITECSDENALENYLGQYNLIICGTDFTSSATGDKTDIDDIKAMEALKQYSDQLKRPVIFTSDAVSYVNSENYFAPQERDYTWRYLTIEEGEKAKKDGSLNETTGEYQRVPVFENAYNDIVIDNKEIQDEKKGYKGEGTVYLESDPKWEIEKVNAGAYYAVLRPVTDTSIEDGRSYQKRRLGYDYHGIFKNEQKSWEDADKIAIPKKDGTNINVRITEMKELLGEQFVKQNGFWFIVWINLPSYYTNIGYVTQTELEELYYANGSVMPDGSEGVLNAIEQMIQTGVEGKYDTIKEEMQFYYRDIHSAVTDLVSIPSQIVDIENKITIAGQDYYNFTAGNGKQYLALRTEQPIERKWTYVWQRKVRTGEGQTATEINYVLSDVAGNADALYPERNVWNYYFTQSMRNRLGMDRFGVTTALEPEEKKDKGSSRRWAEKKEIQGFTNAALLEFAYIPQKNTPGDGTVNVYSQYGDSLLALGTAPRTNMIEAVNEGPITGYPFSIENENFSDPKIEVLLNHAPYYQLDLERTPEEIKSEDVTVWYTLSDSQDSALANGSRYFQTTRKDAGNNYYLYSKGKLFYTGFSLNDTRDDSSDDTSTDFVRELEMKLFINTIYAALTADAPVLSYYEVLADVNGYSDSCTLSSLNQSDTALKPGENHQYVCYYDEYTEMVTISLRVQKESVQPESPVPVLVKSRTSGENEYANLFPDILGVTKDGENVDLKQFPVMSVQAAGTQDGGQWCQVTVNVKNLDTKSLLFAVGESENSDLPLANSVHAEVRFVMRNLFDLD